MIHLPGKEKSSLACGPPEGQSIRRELEGGGVEVFLEDDCVGRDVGEGVAAAAQLVPGGEDEILESRVVELKEALAEVFGRPEAEDFEEDSRARLVSQDEVGDEGAVAEVYDFAARLQRPSAADAPPRRGEFFDDGIVVSPHAQVVRAQTRLLARQLEVRDATAPGLNLGAHAPALAQKERGQEDGHLYAVLLRALEDRGGAVQANPLPPPRGAADGADYAVGLFVAQQLPLGTPRPQAH